MATSKQSDVEVFVQETPLNSPLHVAHNSGVVVPETPLVSPLHMAHSFGVAEPEAHLDSPGVVVPETPFREELSNTSSSGVVCLGRRQVPRSESQITPCDAPSVRLSPTVARSSLWMSSSPSNEEVDYRMD